MKRNMIIILILSIITFGCIVRINQSAIAKNETYPPVMLQKGTFLKGMSTVEISTGIADIGDEVCFINPIDMYVGERNVTPKNSRYYGYIEDVREPVQGTNGAFKIKINKMITPDKQIIPMDAYLYGANDNYVGGELTHPAYYDKTPSYSVGWKLGILQYVPTNIREYGKHTVIKPGAELIIILADDLYLK